MEDGIDYQITVMTEAGEKYDITVNNNLLFEDMKYLVKKSINKGNLSVYSAKFYYRKKQLYSGSIKENYIKQGSIIEIYDYY